MPSVFYLRHARLSLLHGTLFTPGTISKLRGVRQEQERRPFADMVSLDQLNLSTTAGVTRLLTSALRLVEVLRQRTQNITVSSQVLCLWLGAPSRAYALSTLSGVWVLPHVHMHPFPSHECC